MRHGKCGSSGAHEGKDVVGPVNPESEGVDVVEQADQGRPVEEATLSTR